MSDYITTPRGNRITADQVDQLITALKVISTWAHCQVEYHYEISEAVLRQIERKATEALESITLEFSGGNAVRWNDLLAVINWGGGNDSC